MFLQALVLSSHFPLGKFSHSVLLLAALYNSSALLEEASVGATTAMIFSGEVRLVVSLALFAIAGAILYSFRYYLVWGQKLQEPVWPNDILSSPH